MLRGRGDGDWKGCNLSVSERNDEQYRAAPGSLVVIASRFNQRLSRRATAYGFSEKRAANEYQRAANTTRRGRWTLATRNCARIGSSRKNSFQKPYLRLPSQHENNDRHSRRPPAAGQGPGVAERHQSAAVRDRHAAVAAGTRTPAGPADRSAVDAGLRRAGMVRQPRCQQTNPFQRRGGGPRNRAGHSIRS